eukprot:m.49980 g.49980  ORF g.49980 m.49980 type:complete len:227 (-) comp10879_c0_seq3:3313-3993(-)
MEEFDGACDANAENKSPTLKMSTTHVDDETMDSNTIISSGCSSDRFSNRVRSRSFSDYLLQQHSTCNSQEEKEGVSPFISRSFTTTTSHKTNRDNIINHNNGLQGREQKKVSFTDLSSDTSSLPRASISLANIKLFKAKFKDKTLFKRNTLEEELNNKVEHHGTFVTIDPHAKSISYRDDSSREGKCSMDDIVCIRWGGGNLFYNAITDNFEDIHTLIGKEIIFIV